MDIKQEIRNLREFVVKANELAIEAIQWSNESKQRIDQVIQTITDSEQTEVVSEPVANAPEPEPEPQPVVAEAATISINGDVFAGQDFDLHVNLGGTPGRFYIHFGGDSENFKTGDWYLPDQTEVKYNYLEPGRYTVRGFVQVSSERIGVLPIQVEVKEQVQEVLPEVTATTPEPEAPVAAEANEHKEFYLSHTGDDRNPGTIEQPFATINKAKSALRSGYADKLYIEKGSVFASPFGYFSKKGKDRENHMVISTYGTGPRPIFHCGRENGFLCHVGAGFSFVTISGISLKGDGGNYGIRFIEVGENAVFEDLEITGFGTAASFEAHQGSLTTEEILENQRNGINPYKDVTFRNNVAYHNSRDRGHSQGVFHSGLETYITEGNMHYFNGMSPGDRETDISGNKLRYNHQEYGYFGLSGKVISKNNIYLYSPSHGSQMRTGGDCIDNIFEECGIGLTILDSPSKVEGNFFLKATNIGGQGSGMGIQAESCESITIKNNVFANKNSEAALHAAAIEVRAKPHNRNGIGGDPWHRWIGNETGTVDCQDNIVYNWPMLEGRHAHIKLTDPFLTEVVDENNVIYKEGEGNFVDPKRTIESYCKLLGGTEDYEEFCRLRIQGSELASFEAVYSYLKQGYAKRQP